MQGPALVSDTLATPLGELRLVAHPDGALCGIDWTDHDARLRRLLDLRWRGWTMRDARDPWGFRRALADYFAGDLAVLDTLPVMTGGTSFQQCVWRALRAIPCGTTITYGELARRVGRPRAVRAVGHANGANAIGIVVPCHRVVGADGALTGYGSGLPRKQWLLAHESIRRPAPGPAHGGTQAAPVRR
ncbi:MAG: methylated-DNA--[protein]-cysteine S-methyltransferase [Gammaproteobacteria bacterium]